MSLEARGPATAEETGRACPYCRSPLEQGVETARCATCVSAHHAECWDENQGCAVVMCPGGPAPGTHPERPSGKPGKPDGNVPPGQGKPPMPARRKRAAVLVGAVVAVLLLGGIATAAIVGGGSASGTSNAAGGNDGQSTDIDTDIPVATADAGLSEEDTIAEIARLVDVSKRGRAATRDRNYDDANEIRRSILDELDALDTAELENERSLLQRAMRASIKANQVRVKCASCAVEYDDRATSLKEEFVDAFNPYAEDSLGETYDADDI